MSVLSIEPEKKQGLLYSGLHLAIVLLLVFSTQQGPSITPPKGIAIQAEIMDLEEYMKSIKKPSENKPVIQPPPEQVKPEPPKPEPKPVDTKPEPKQVAPKPEPKVVPKPVEKQAVKPQVNEVKRTEKTERQKKLEESSRKRQEAEAQVNQPTEPTNEPTQPDAKPPIGVQNGDETAKRTQLTLYSAAIDAAVTRQWARPNGTPAGLQCQIKVNQIPGGGVIDVSIGSPCNASAVVRNSIINAVKKADPLPYKGFEEVFQRRITFTFQYQGD